jgi:CRISPR system Cascade subunit CasE
MYLSKLELDRNKPGVRQSLRNCQDMHRTIMKAFPQNNGERARQELGILYRVHSAGNAIGLYVLSEIKPDFQLVFENGFVFNGCKDITEFISSFEDGNYYSFDVLLNPSKKVPRADGGNSRRTILKSSEERSDWLKRKAEVSGFSLEWFREEGSQKIFGRHGESAGGEMYIDCIRFKGVMKITNSLVFSDVYKKGIGSDKAYGLGMLLLGKC